MIHKFAENKNTLSVENVTEIVEETLQDNEKNVNECWKNDTKFLPKQSSTDSASSDSQFSSSPSKFSYFYQGNNQMQIIGNNKKFNISGYTICMC